MVCADVEKRNKKHRVIARRFTAVAIQTIKNEVLVLETNNVRTIKTSAYALEDWIATLATLIRDDTLRKQSP